MTYLLRTCPGGAWSALALTLLLTSTAQAEPDVLERPSMTSVKASSSVMLAVATAGTRLVAAGERGIIIYSDTNGETWQQAAVPVSVSLTSIRFVDSVHGWAVGHSGVVLHTADGGKNWIRQLDGAGAARLVLQAVKSSQPKPDSRALANAERLVAEGPSKPFLDTYFFDQRQGLVVGAFGLMLATSDGGASWKPAQDRIDNPKDKHLYSIHVAGTACYVTGEQGALFRSDDCRTRFDAIPTPYAGTYFGAIVSSPDSLLVYGMRGNAYWSENAGASWSKSDIPTTSSLTTGLRLQDGALLLADETGQPYHSVDGGKTFARVPIAQASPVTGVVQSRTGELYFSGVRGVTRIVLNTKQ